MGKLRAIQGAPVARASEGTIGSSQGEEPMVLGKGLEPLNLTAYAPEAYVSTNSTTRAHEGAFPWTGMRSNKGVEK